GAGAYSGGGVDEAEEASDRRGPGADTQLGVDVLEMLPDGARGEPEEFGNLGIRLAPRPPQKTGRPPEPSAAPPPGPLPRRARRPAARPSEHARRVGGSAAARHPSQTTPPTQGGSGARGRRGG